MRRQLAQTMGGEWRRGWRRRGDRPVIAAVVGAVRQPVIAGSVAGATSLFVFVHAAVEWPR
jgi:hypothetical protein